MNITVQVADKSHLPYAESVCHELYLSSLGDKIGIAQRTPEYIRDKIRSGKAVIALTDEGEFAGFSYIESWGGKSFVANSGLIVPEKFRSKGIARRIKEQTFILSRKLFPNAKIFSMTTSSDWMQLPCDAIKLGPGDSARSHRADEFILVSEIEAAIAQYITFIESFYGNFME